MGFYKGATGAAVPCLRRWSPLAVVRLNGSAMDDGELGHQFLPPIHSSS
ncbi:hypothetical protein SynMVIR181_01143 [Synechococcus sp. MVIR-18-1]|nr:hypothetical protein SynMVIR181_01143 [Synechococcus sp. MVIR-18-1]